VNIVAIGYTTALALAGLVLCGAFGVAHAQQFPLMDKLADKVVAKYQNSSCEQLAAQRGQKPTGRKAAMEERVVGLLHTDPQMRAEFMNRVAAPIANKLFECGIIP
jgi:hypothetical protein